MPTLKVNGRVHDVPVSDDAPLLFVLRNDLKLNGPKFGCGLAQCGACLVLVDGQPVRYCVTSAGAVAGQLLHGYVGAPDVISSALEAAELRFRLPSHKLESPMRTKPEEIPHEFSDHSDWRPQVFPGYF
jgi:hypothetical protein